MLLTLCMDTVTFFENPVYSFVKWGHCTSLWEDFYLKDFFIRHFGEIYVKMPRVVSVLKKLNYVAENVKFIWTHKKQNSLEYTHTHTHKVPELLATH